MTIDASLVLTRGGNVRLAERAALPAQARWRVVDDLEAFEGLAESWRALEAATPGAVLFQTYSWCWHWVRHYATGPNAPYKLRIVAIEGATGSKLLALVPLVVPRRGAKRFAQWLGEPLLQYGDILLDPSANIPAVRQSLSEAISGWSDTSAFHLRSVRADANVHKLIELQRFAICEPRESASLDLTRYADAAAYEAGKKPKDRKQHRRKRRRLEEFGPVAFEVVQGGCDASALVAKAIGFKEIWLKEMGLTSRAFMDKRALGCLTEMAEDCEHDCGCTVAHLTVGKRTAALGIDFRHAGHVYAFMGAFNPVFAQAAPGAAQIDETIAHAIGQGLQTYDLLAPFDRYKSEWTNQTTEVRDYAVPLDLWSAAYVELVLRRLRPALKALYLRSPAHLRRRAAALLRMTRPRAS
jgi:CelD/BcsL family acetyltransferase involved in cellulose biosynthesis